MAVLSILMMILLQATSASLNIWRRSENKITVTKEARATTLLMAQDLQNIAVPLDTNLWPKARSQSLVFLVSRPPGYQSASASTNAGDICFVEYRVTYQQDRSFIERGEVESTLTLRTLTNLPPRFPTPTTYQMLATNVFSIEMRLLNASGTTNIPAGEPPTFVEVAFSVAPSQDAYKALWAGQSSNQLQIEKVLLRSPLPKPR